MARFANVSRLTKAKVRIGVLEDALEEALTYIERFEDVRDGDYGAPEPNEAMQLASVLRAVLSSPATERRVGK